MGKVIEVIDWKAIALVLTEIHTLPLLLSLSIIGIGIHLASPVRKADKQKQPEIKD